MRADMDEDFARFVAARQRTFLRAAYLVCGDPVFAREVVEGAFAAMAPRWRALKDERPEAQLRSRVYRSAVARAPAAVSAPDPWEPEPMLGQLDVADEEPRAEELLGLLTPRQRALAVLVHHEGLRVAEAGEVLGLRTATAARELALAMTAMRERREALRRDDQGMGDAVPPADSWDDGPVDDGTWDATGSWLSGLMDRSAGSAPDTELAVSSWERSRRTRATRRRRVAAVAAIAVVGTAGVVVAGRKDPGQPPRLAASGGPRASATPAVTPEPWRPASSVAVDGTPFLTGPAPAQLPALVPLDVGLPREIGWDRTPVSMGAVLQPRDGHATVAVHVCAAMLRSGLGGLYEPVLLLRDDRTGAWTNVLVNVALIPTGVEFDSDRIPVVTRAIDPSGTKVTWIQPDGVVVADVQAGTVRRFAMPSGAAYERLSQGGFDAAGQIVVQSAAKAWRVDPNTGAVREVPPTTEGAAARLAVVGGAVSLVSYGPDGLARQQRPVRLPADQTWGETVAGAHWAATGALVDAGSFPADGAPRRSALVAASVPDATHRRALAFTDPSIAKAPTGSVRALAMVGDIVVFSYTPDSEATWVLGFDLGTGEVTRVSRVQPSVAGVGTPAQSIAIWVPRRG